MIPGRIRIAVLAVSAAMLLGGCTQLHHRERSREVIDIADKCTLSPEALVERIADVKASLGSRILERAELDDGIAIRFLTDPQTIPTVFEFVAAERRCCGSFLTFEVILGGGDGAFWLRVRGNRDDKELLMEMFNVDGGR